MALQTHIIQKEKTENEQVGGNLQQQHPITPQKSHKRVQ